MKPPRAFCEIPAGLASVSLHLQGGRYCKPPVSRQGSKVGYAHIILDAMGLRPGLGAESYLWTEACPDVRALLCAYTQPDLLRAVAEVLRGWASEEPRALWARLRDERRARVAAVPPAEHVAEWMFLHHGSYSHKGIEAGIGCPQGGDHNLKPGLNPRQVPTVREIVHDAALRLARGPGWPPVAVTATAPSAEEVAGWLAFQTHTLKTGGFAAEHVGSPGSRRPADLPVGRVGELASLPWPLTLVTAQAPSAERVAEWAMIVASNRLINVSGPDLRNTGKGGTTFGGTEFATSAAEVAAGFERGASSWPPTAITSRAPTAEEVAGWAFLVGNSWKSEGDHWKDPSEYVKAIHGTEACLSAGQAAERFGALAEVSTRPTETTPGVDLEGCVIYQDWPYRNTTPYAHDLARAEQVRLALEYAAAGALVVLSEATPYEELTALGWEAVNIGGERRGQKRTFGATEEWLTMSSPPVNRPRIQVGLFG